MQAGDDAWERIPGRFGADPVQHAESRELADALRRAVTEALSDRQRRVFVAIIVPEFEGNSKMTCDIFTASSR